MIGNASEAEDLAQEVFVQLFRKNKRLEELAQTRPSEEVEAECD